MDGRTRVNLNVPPPPNSGGTKQSVKASGYSVKSKTSVSFDTEVLKILQQMNSYINKQGQDLKYLSDKV
jgi:hypothetical protein